MTEVPDEEEVTSPEQQEEVVQPPPEIANAEFTYTDHRTYAQALYKQPVWVVDAVFGPGGLDQNAKHTPTAVTSAIDQMMAQPDKQFEEVPQ